MAIASLISPLRLLVQAGECGSDVVVEGSNRMASLVCTQCGSRSVVSMEEIPEVSDVIMKRDVSQVPDLVGDLVTNRGVVSMEEVYLKSNLSP